MKKLYLLVFLLFVAIGFSQDSPESKGDIEGFSLYPNPVTHGKVYITTHRNAPKRILIFDVFGTRVMETTILGKELNLTNLDAGVYVVRVFESDRVATRKLIVK